MDLQFVKMLLIMFALTSITNAGVSPNIPADRRTEYFFIKNDNQGYKYGYDTGSGIYAKQVGNAENRVVGQYGYSDSNGQPVVVNYRSGPEGYIPEGYEKFISNVKTSETPQTWQSEALPENKYKFAYSTSDSRRQETSDELGKKEGKYSFQNKDNKMDVTYAADGKMGFKMTSGNTASKQLPIPENNLFPELQNLWPLNVSRPGGGGGNDDDNKNNGAYSFQYSNPESSRVESSDENGNIKGQYSYVNDAGTHDLSYIAGPGIGFQPTGGSLAQPNGLNGAQPTSKQLPIPGVGGSPGFLEQIWQDFSQTISNPEGGDESGGDNQNNGAYSFQYSNPESSRVESSDENGNIKGQYSYVNDAGTHDLSYIAGPGVGFQPTGGSLAQPNGLNGAQPTSKQLPIPGVGGSPGFLEQIWQDFSQTISNPEGGDESGGDNQNNGAYSFQYSNPESSRVESSDENGNIKGQYSYVNDAGTHDLSYIAGPGVGFQPTGGSLAQPNGLTGKLLLVKTSQEPLQSSSSTGIKTSVSETTKNYKPQPELQYLPPQTKSNSPISYISDDTATVEKYFPPGQHGKTGYVIRYKQ